MELRQFREAHGMSCEEVGERLDWSGAKVSRIETARNAVHSNDLKLLLDLYGVSDPERRDALLQLARTSRQRGWWNAYRDVVPERRWVYVRLEDEATLIRSYEVEFVPGLLQTEEYARACLKAGRPNDTPEAVERRVALRVARQAILTRDTPPQLWFILNEAALHRVRALPVAAAKEQLGRLAAATDLPNVTLQVLPFSIGPHAGMDGAFTMLRFPEGANRVRPRPDERHLAQEHPQRQRRRRQLRRGRRPGRRGGRAGQQGEGGRGGAGNWPYRVGSVHRLAGGNICQHR
jgi:transcriptional regulator with XRE-family HTH domain